MGYFDSIYASGLPHRAVTVYMYLKNRAGREKRCFPSVGTIATDLSLSRRTVERALNELEVKGYLVRESRWRPKGGRSSNLYTIYDDL